jgi:hypothetical protein
MIRISEKTLAVISVATTCALLWIWVLPNTIALRHALLAVGCISGIFLISNYWHELSSSKIILMPLCLLVLLFIWVGIHYSFFSLNPELELSEIKGLWIRSIAGCIMAVGFGISLCQHKELRKYFYISIFAVPLINVASYFYDCFLTGKFLMPSNFIKFYFAKIETAYFGGIAAAVAVANLIYLLSRKVEKKTYSLIALYIFGMALVLFSNMLSSTKNGIAISMGLCLLLSVVILVKSFMSIRGSKKVAIIVLALLVIMVTLIGYGHKSSAYKGWDTIFEDVKVALDIDKNTQWQSREGSVTAPLNSLGVPAALNTYSRFAWIAVGTRLIKQHPLGYGSVNQSFNGMQSYAEIYHEHTGQVHSGWVDFGLAFGLPGLTFIFLALITIILLGLRQQGVLPLVAVIYCLMVIPFGFIAEISYKQYFEATLFFIAFAASIVALTPTLSVEEVV